MARIAITGATKGIGLAIAKKFAMEGHDVAACARSKKGLLDLERELKELNPHGSFLTISCDVGEREDLKRFSSEIAKVWGSLDILINNAGVFMPGKISEEKEGVFETTMEVNVSSAYHLTRLLLPKMIGSKDAYIFNICSTASTKAYSNGGSYCISKFALLGFSKVLREELMEKGIRVTAVMPGPTLTSSWEGVDLPESRFMGANDVANMVYQAFLLPAGTVVEEITMRPILGDI